MKGAHYPTDLTDAEWAVLQPLIPPPKAGGRPREVDMRAVLNAAFYVHHGHGGWRQLPRSFPPWQTVYGYVRTWQQDGTWQRLLAARRDAAHRAAGQGLRADVARSAR